MKRILTLLMTMAALLGLTITAQAATYSSYWVEENGVWKVKDPNGNVVTNAWLCDDAVAENGKDVWYLLDANGNMLTYGLVQDKTGNYYSLEMDHNGYYGMLRYKSGTYDGVALELESSHDGSFAAIKNEAGINVLADKYGVVQIDIDNNNIVYTSSFGNGSSGGNGGSSTGSSSSNSGVSSEDIVAFLISYNPDLNMEGSSPIITIDSSRPEVPSGITNIRIWSVHNDDPCDKWVCWITNFGEACLLAANPEGYLYVNTTTPDGYTVDAYGRLSYNGEPVNVWEMDYYHDDSDVKLKCEYTAMNGMRITSPYSDLIHSYGYLSGSLNFYLYNNGVNHLELDDNFKPETRTYLSFK